MTLKEAISKLESMTEKKVVLKEIMKESFFKNLIKELKQEKLIGPEKCIYIKNESIEGVKIVIPFIDLVINAYKNTKIKGKNEEFLNTLKEYMNKKYPDLVLEYSKANYPNVSKLKIFRKI